VVPLRLQAPGDLLAVVALDLDGAVLHRAARAAQALQVARDRLQVAWIEAAHHGHGLAAAAALLARDADDAVARRGRGWQTALAGAPQVAALRGVDRPAVGHCRRIVLGRYAPSPSGLMHLGNARTALLAWLQARAAGGRIALRIEDLDRDRCRPAWVEPLRDDLHWLGLDWDLEQQRQSERGALYDAALERLAAAGAVYECFCTRAEVRAASAPHGPEPVYPGTCRDLTDAERAARRAAGRRAALRLRVPSEQIAFDDLVHGPQSVDVAAGGDFVVRRADGLHAYQLAVVVDDGELGVTHVLRGDDLLSSTPRQILLQRLLGLPTPVYAHVPLMRAAGGERLAKRHAAATVQAIREAGRPAAGLVGELAASVGLAEPGEALAPADLVDRFRGATLRGWAS